MAVTAAERARAYYVQNRDRILARVKARAEAKREEVAAYKREWWAKNAEQCRAEKRARYAANREQILAQQKAAYAADPEKAKQQVKRYRAANPENARAQKQRWVDSNRERYREQKRAYAKAHPEHGRMKIARRRARQRQVTVGEIDYRRVIARCEWTCGICGCPIEGAYHFDHIMPLAAGGPHTEENLQMAHPRCNVMKGAKVA